MAVIRPPITGDALLDSWTNQVAQALTLGTGTGTGSAAEEGQAGAAGFNTATLFLYRRHVSGTVTPDDLETDLIYNYETGVLEDEDGGLGPWDGWYRAIPEPGTQTGNYVWVITVNIADNAETEDIASTTWSAATSLTSPDIVVTDPDTGQIIVDGMLYAYLYRYLDSAYSTSSDGSTDFSPTVEALPDDLTVFYQGLRNSDSTSSSTDPDDFIWEEITLEGDDTTSNVEAYWRRSGGRQIDWLFEGSATEGYTQESGAVIDLDNLQIPGQPPLPSVVTNPAIEHTSADHIKITWNFAFADVGFDGLMANIEYESEDDVWVSIATVASPIDEIDISGVAVLRNNRNYRITTINGSGIAGQPTADLVFAPVTPSVPTSFIFTRDSQDAGFLTWDYVENLSILTGFSVEIQKSDGTFANAGVADSADRSFSITGLAGESGNFTYRVRSIALSTRESGPSVAASFGPPTVTPVTTLSAMPIELVGVLTSVDLRWTYGVDDFNTLVTATIQFRPVVVPEAEWVDVQTVSAGETEADNLPPQQGFVEYRIRVTALNGQNSTFTESGAVFISGGSATDDAIYGGDGSYISAQHYSVNADDEFMSEDEVVTVSGGTIDTDNERIEGIDGEQLSIDWAINVTANSVARNRHFYLNLDNLETVGTNPLRWGVDEGNVFLEILTSPEETAPMYSSDDDFFIYTDGDSSTSANTRTFNARASGGFMYATRTYVRLPMRRTFTFREAGAVLIRLRFRETASAHVRIPLDDGNRISFEAYATEKIDAITLSNVNSTGTVWTFDEDFEAAPMILTTPMGNNNTWFTERQADGSSVRIHADIASPGGVTVDVTARGR